jgi:hypothetical protein
MNDGGIGANLLEADRVLGAADHGDQWLVRAGGA